MNDNKKVEGLYNGEIYCDALYDSIRRAITDYAGGKISTPSVIGILEMIKYDIFVETR